MHKLWHSEAALCRCDCGAEKVVALSNLTRGRSTQCRRCSFAKKTARARPEYGSWYMMVYRCTNPRSPDYARWGGRGITVCQQWLEFDRFLIDVGQRPAGKMLDRIDNTAGYYPGNVRWATAIEQSANRRNTAIISVGGESKPLTQIARENGLRASMIHKRIAAGWSPERAISEPSSRANQDPSSANSTNRRGIGQAGQSGRHPE